MSLPVSWLSAATLPGLSLAQRSLKSASQSTQKAFGSLLQTPQPANGPSEVGEPSTKTKPSDPQSQIRSELEPLIATLRKQLGESSTQDLEIRSSGDGIPEVRGPEKLAGAVREYLANKPSLVSQINQLARSTLNADPLQWMPGTQHNLASAGTPLRMLFPA